DYCSSNETELDREQSIKARTIDCDSLSCYIASRREVRYHRQHFEVGQSSCCAGFVCHTQLSSSSTGRNCDFDRSSSQRWSRRYAYISTACCFEAHSSYAAEIRT